MYQLDVQSFSQLPSDPQEQIECDGTAEVLT
jgi:hypothetical protein